MTINRRMFLTAVGGLGALGALPARPAVAAGPAASTINADVSAAAPSRDSVFTRRGAGPLYWSTYGYNFPHDAPIPESVWQDNIDWIATDLAGSGYDMACTDGWIDYTQHTNANGYILSYNDSWTHDWSYWASYLARKGMRLGVYYDPLWVCRSAVEDPSKTVVGRPDVPISAIVEQGDFFGGAGGSRQLYWVDVTRDGAEEYVRGYVDYFRNIGAAYLRVDFLSWYESGYDANSGTVGKAHGSQNYATALRWMSEAAGNGIELSLVMPNLFGHGATERNYGDLVRIDDDAGSGGWSWLSGGRQAPQPGWSQWHNPFLGFTGFSDVSGRGQLILDGDFLAMHPFASDDERRTALNLFTIAGSPIAIGDTVDTIGDDASFFRNVELLDLHRKGLVGKPYYYNGNAYESDFGSRDSERWMGQLPDGSWVVGLFNRNDGPQPTTKTIDFGADLGIVGTAAVRDVWRHQDLGRLGRISTSLRPHASQLVTVTPGEAVRRYQAEFAARGGTAHFNNDHSGHAAMGFVDGLGNAAATVTFAVLAPTAGSYPITYRYGNATGATSTMTVLTETVDGDVVDRVTVDFADLANWDTWAGAGGDLQLASGQNMVRIMRTDNDVGAINLDYIEIEL